MKIVLSVPYEEEIFINSLLEKVYILPDDRMLYIRPEALEKMFKYKQVKWTDTEAGGILIGRILEEDDNIIIDDVSEPMPSDKRKRTRFSRNTEGHQGFMNEAFDREEGSCFYLGEWHTHPQRIPVPSSVDWRGWKRLLKAGYESGCLLFIIVGTDNLKVWYGYEGDEPIVVELKRRGKN